MNYGPVLPSIVACLAGISGGLSAFGIISTGSYMRTRKLLRDGYDAEEIREMHKERKFNDSTSPGVEFAIKKYGKS